MGNWDNYKPEEASHIGAGDHRCEIVAAEETVSKSSGAPMIVATVRINKSNIKVKSYFVKNEYFNRNITEFFDSFGIERGDFNFMGWVGCIGAAKFVEDENGYLKVKWFISPEKAKSLPEWEGKKPERQTVSEIDVIVDDDDLPL